MKNTRPEFIVGNAIDVLKVLPDDCADLVFADPPYNVNKNYGGKSKDNRDDYPQWCDKWIRECFRILKSTGTIYIMTLPRHLIHKLPLMAELGVFISLIMWRNASGAFHMERRFFPKWTAIPVFGKTDNYIFNRLAIRQKPKPENLRWGGYRTKAQGQMSDIWDDVPFVYAGSITHKEAILQPGTNKKIHPTQMPEELARRAIAFSTNKDDLVLDPFCGVGTTNRQAYNLRRKSIGIDINADYIKIAQKRCRVDIPSLQDFEEEGKS